jgi:hypothetical protein
MITGIIAGTALALSLAVPAHAATAAPEKGPGPRGEYASGQIRDTNIPGYCITAPQGAEAGDPLFIARCLKGDAFQLWHCAKFEGLGNCSLVATKNPLDIGQQGKLNNVRVVNPDDTPTYFMAFITLSGSGGTLLENTSYKHYLLAMPKRSIVRHLYQIYWLKGGTSPSKYSYSLTFPEWKPNPA